jgi:hypothetical protein
VPPQTAVPHLLGYNAKLPTEEVDILFGINSAHNAALKISELGCIYITIWRAFEVGVLVGPVTRPATARDGNLSSPGMLEVIITLTSALASGTEPPLVTLRCIRVDAVAVNQPPRISVNEAYDKTAAAKLGSSQS